MNAASARPARVLIVAGSDSGGGAGIQADIKTVTCLGGYAMTAVTALTAQDTRGVHGVVGVDPAFIQQQMRVVLRDIGADCIKTGMLHNTEVIEAVAEVLGEVPDVPAVIDPVMVSKSGAALLEAASVHALSRDLLPRARVITPNAPEAEHLTGVRIADRESQFEAGEKLLTLGAEAALVKGGHLSGPDVTDVLVELDDRHAFQDERIETRHTHGTGCTLASAIATGLAQGRDLVSSVRRARGYLRRALETAPGLGGGAGPVNHAWTVRPPDEDV